MKKISLLFIICAMACIKITIAYGSKPATIHSFIQQSDTSRTVKQLLAAKAKYKGQALSLFLKDMPYKIKSFAITLPHKKGDLVNWMYLQLDDSNTEYIKTQNNIHSWVFIIEFEDDLPKSKSWIYAYQNNYAWTPSVQSYFGGLIVKDIRIVGKIPN